MSLRVTIDISEYNELVKIREAFESNSIVFYTRHTAIGMGCVQKELV